jgi:hypothetical protein
VTEWPTCGGALFKMSAIVLPHTESLNNRFSEREQMLLNGRVLTQAQKLNGQSQPFPTPQGGERIDNKDEHQPRASHHPYQCCSPSKRRSTSHFTHPYTNNCTFHRSIDGSRATKPLSSREHPRECETFIASDMHRCYMARGTMRPNKRTLFHPRLVHPSPSKALEFGYRQKKSLPWAVGDASVYSTLYKKQQDDHG